MRCLLTPKKFALFSLLTILSCSQSEKQDGGQVLLSELVFHDEAFHDPSTGNRFSGVAREYHENGKVSKELNIVDGNASGQHRVYSETGVVLLEENYKNNILDGPFFSSYSTGKPFEKGYYSEGELQGEIKTWFRNEKLRYHYYFIKGKGDSIWTEYDSLGNKIAESWQKNGKKDGVTTLFYENGMVKKESFFKEGKKEGEEKVYFEEGKLNSVSSFRDGQLNGKTIIYYPSGRIKEEKNYVKGLPHGVFSFYNEQGKKLMVQNLKEGKNHGLFIKWFDDGSLELKETYVDGVRMD